MTEEQKAEADKLYKRYETWLNEYLDENAEEIVGYFDSLNRFREETARGGNGAPYYKKRIWDWQHEQEGPQGQPGLPQTGQGLAHLHRQDGRGLPDRPVGPARTKTSSPRGYFKASWNPFTWSRIEQINFAVTYGLTAIGLCLMLGLCSPGWRPWAERPSCSSCS